MKRKRKTLVIVLLMILCLAAGSLATYALLSSVTQTATNVFASSRNIGITLDEPKWNDHGEKDAAAYVPGQVIDKDPAVTLSKGSVSSYVAVKVQYFNQQDQEISFKDFEDAYLEKSEKEEEIDFSDSWEFLSSTDGEDADEMGRNGKSVLYLYHSILTQDRAETVDATENVTVPLFTKVHISSAITADQSTKLLPKFKIKVTAYAVQADGVTKEEAETALIALAAKN